MSSEKSRTETMVYLSIILFIALALTSFYNAYFFYDFQLKQLKDGLYVRAKFLYFIILGISACLDLPQYFYCWYGNFPYFCRENTISYEAGICSHILASCGYLYCIITPAILWNDMILLKDGNFWFTNSSLCYTKIFFRTFFVIFCIITVGLIIGDIIYTQTTELNQSNYYLNDNRSAAIAFCVTPTIIFIIVICCLWSGVKLHFYVIKEQVGVKLDLSSKQHRVLIYWNLINLIFALSYFLKVLILLGRWNKMPSSYKDDFQRINGHYDIWVPLAQWLPSVFCSFCQIKGMQYKRFEAIELLPSTTISAINLANIKATTATTLSLCDTDSPMHGDYSFTMRQQSNSIDDSFLSPERTQSEEMKPVDRFFSTDVFRATSSDIRPSTIVAIELLKAVSDGRCNSR